MADVSIAFAHLVVVAIAIGYLFLN